MNEMHEFALIIDGKPEDEWLTLADTATAEEIALIFHRPGWQITAKKRPDLHPCPSCSYHGGHCAPEGVNADNIATCCRCGGIFSVGDISRSTAARYVDLSSWHDGEEGESIYFDFVIKEDGHAQYRTHGWVNSNSRRLVQTG